MTLVRSFIYKYVYVLVSLAIGFNVNSIYASMTELTYEKFFRLNNPINKSESGDWLGFNFETRPVETKLDYFINGDLRFYFQDDNNLNYSIQEAYLSYLYDDYRIYFGRRILDWNTNEKYWSLGYLNALQSFTLLSTEEEGVTGLFLSKEVGRFEFELMGSYFYIPQINPSYDIKNGEIKSKSEWMRLPPKKTVVSGKEVDIHYDIADYKIHRILLNKSLGFNIRYKWNNGGVAAFAIYKPENALRVNANAFYDNLGTQKVMVTADPTVNHHAYYGIQLYQAFGDIKARGGFSYVDPNAKLGKDFLIDISNARKTFKSEYFNINPSYVKEAYAHMSLIYDKQKKYKLSLNYIHLITDNVRSSDDFFSDTIKWKSTVGSGINYYFNDSFEVAFDLKYDLERKDNIVKGEIRYNYLKQVNLSLGLEVLKAPDANSYWSYYRTSDTLYTSVGFVF